MKKLTNAILPVRIGGVDISSITYAKFKFKQGSSSKVFVYPSDDATVIGRCAIGLHFKPEDTAMFDADKAVEFDSLIKVNDSPNFLDTKPSTIKLTPTLFTIEEIDDD